MQKILILNRDRDMRVAVEQHPSSDMFQLGQAEDFQLILEHGKKLQVFYKMQKDIPFSYIYFRVWKHKIDSILPIHKALHKLGFPVHVDEITHHSYQNKLIETMLFHEHNLRIPKTLFVARKHIPACMTFIQDTMAFPCIIKDIQGKRGEVNFLVKSEQDILDVLGEHPDVEFIFQEYIENQFDYRFLVLDGAVAYAYKRMRSPETHTHLNNVSAGGTAELVDPKDVPDLVPLAEKAASVLGRTICGVDILQGKNGKAYFLEGNACPGLKSFDVGNVFVDYLREKAQTRS